MEKLENDKIYIPKVTDKYRYEEKDKRVISLKKHLEWIKRQLEYVEFANEYKIRFALKKGEIYEFDWGVNVNAEFSNRHYGVVLRDSSEYDPLVLVCPLKTNKNGAHPASDVDLGYIDDLQSEVKTLGVVNQIRSIDKMRIFSKSKIGDSSIFKSKIPVLSDDKVELLLTAYLNFIHGKSL